MLRVVLSEDINHLRTVRYNKLLPNPHSVHLCVWPLSNPFQLLLGQPEELHILVDDNVLRKQTSIPANELFQGVHGVLQVLRLLDDLLNLNVCLAVVSVPGLRVAGIRDRTLTVRQDNHTDVGRFKLVIPRRIIIDEGRMWCQRRR